MREAVHLKRVSNQFIKFAFVGVFNTALTALTIWILLEKFQFSNYLSNIVGFIIGLTNSFVWNRKWTFESTLGIGDTLIKFLITFAICYLVQLLNLYILLHYTDLEPFICQFISIGIYTFINFTLNKYYTFKS
jgi:putative flippase GtrA